VAFQETKIADEIEPFRDNFAHFTGRVTRGALPEFRRHCVGMNIARFANERKVDLDAGLQNLKSYIDSLVNNLKEYIDERTHDAETRLLRGFADYNNAATVRCRKLAKGARDRNL
jgi:hypothetical protein